MTHAGDFSVSAKSEPVRLCDACAMRPDLRHPPCPPAMANEGANGIYMFALRSVDIGSEASTWGVDYPIGIDQDCSDRPEGNPVECISPSQTGQWGRLSGGVDNALATQVFYPVQQLTNINPRDRITASLEAGLGVHIVLLDGWNGTPNDPRVGVRMLMTSRLANADGRRQPTWQGDDEWIVYADGWDNDFPAMRIPDTTAKSPDGYVRDGILVWDARALAAFRITFIAIGGGVFEMPLANASLFGRLAMADRPRLLTNGVISGLWNAHFASRSARAITQLGMQCDPCGTVNATPIVEKLIAEASDMLLPSSQGATYCDAISVGLLGNYVEIKAITGIVPAASIPISCADAGVCEAISTSQ